MINQHESLLQFLIEIRKRLLICLFIFAFIFLSLLCFANGIFSFFASPLLKLLPQGQHLIATELVSSFFVPFDLTLVASFFLIIPILLYQVWAFVAPALYPNERKAFWILLSISSVLFYAGLLFAYYVMFPIMFKFLIFTAPAGVEVMPDIQHFFKFAVKLFLIFGCLFEIPILILTVIGLGLLSRDQLIEWRRYIIVLAFIIAMFLAPPDVISQTLLALPLWLLFEIGILLAKFFPKRENLVQQME